MCRNESGDSWNGAGDLNWGAGVERRQGPFCTYLFGGVCEESFRKKDLMRPQMQPSPVEAHRIQPIWQQERLDRHQAARHPHNTQREICMLQLTRPSRIANPTLYQGLQNSRGRSHHRWSSFGRNNMPFCFPAQCPQAPLQGLPQSTCFSTATLLRLVFVVAYALFAYPERAPRCWPATVPRNGGGALPLMSCNAYRKPQAVTAFHRS